MKELTLENVQKMNELFEMRMIDFKSDPNYGEKYLQFEACKITKEKKIEGNERVYLMTLPGWEGKLFVGESYNHNGTSKIKKMGFKLEQIK